MSRKGSVYQKFWCIKRHLRSLPCLEAKYVYVYRLARLKKITCSQFLTLMAAFERLAIKRVLKDVIPEPPPSPLDEVL